MFYTKMLREQDELMGNTGFDPDMVVNSDDKYAIDLKDIAQAVEDINDEYAEESEQEELDGQDLHEDPVAECMIAIYENEHNWNLIMQAIGTHELMESARGREMLMTEAETTSFIDRVKEWFTVHFKKITDAVKKFIEDTMSMSRTCAAFHKKYASKLSEGKAAFDNSKKEALKGYMFKTDAVKDCVEAARNVMGEVHKAKDDDLQAYTAKEGSMDALYAKFGIKGESPAKEFKAKYRGEKVTLTYSPADVAEILKSGPDKIKKVREIYSGIKNLYNAIIKSLNDLKKSVDKADKKGEAMTGLTKYIDHVKKANNVIHIAYSTGMSAMRAEILQAIRVAHAWVGSIEKPKKEKSEKKSTKTESAGFFGALELL